MVSQNAIPSKKHLGGSLPFVFTEQGIANIASVFTNKRAIEVNIQIMRAFVSMRKFISQNASVLNRIENIEKRQLSYEMKTDEQFEKIFDALQNNEVKQEIFYDGQVFDAYKFVCDLIKKAKKNIILIDNYIDESVLTLFSKRNKGVSIIIYTHKISRQLKLDIDKFNSQYENIIVKGLKNSHDRFMIIDTEEVYHFGASLKDLGKKWFAFSKFENKAIKMLEKIQQNTQGLQFLPHFMGCIFKAPFFVDFCCNIG